MVSSPKHLELVLDKAFDPVDAETIDCLYRCYFWMAFFGLKDVDALEVKVAEVDFENLLINHDGKTYEMYRESIPAFKMACNLTEFCYIHPQYSNTIRRERATGEYLMRGIRSDRMKLYTIRSTIGKRFGERSIQISYGKVYLSGVFYRAYEMERAGFTPNFDDIVIEKLDSVKRAYSRNYTKNKAANAIERGLQDDYASWKQAFA